MINNEKRQRHHQQQHHQHLYLTKLQLFVCNQRKAQSGSLQPALLTEAIFNRLGHRDSPPSAPSTGIAGAVSGGLPQAEEAATFTGCDSDNFLKSVLRIFQTTK